MNSNSSLFLSSSAPIINDNNDINNQREIIRENIKEEIVLNDDIINELTSQGNDIIPKPIKLFNSNHETPLMIPSSINSLVNYKTKNFRNINALHDNPNIYYLFIEYKKYFKGNFIGSINKISVHLKNKHINDTFKAILDLIDNCFYSENYIKNLIFNKIFIDLNTDIKIKDNIIKSYCILLKLLKDLNNYNFVFHFNRDFLNKYGNSDNEENATRFNYFINNIMTLINNLSKYDFIKNEDMFEFLDAILLNPNYRNISFTTFCMRILNLIHNIHNDYYNKYGLYKASRDYLKNNYKIKIILENVKNEYYDKDKPPFLYFHIMELLDNIINDKCCCEICEKNLISFNEKKYDENEKNDVFYIIVNKIKNIDNDTDNDNNDDDNILSDDEKNIISDEYKNIDEDEDESIICCYDD